MRAKGVLMPTKIDIISGFLGAGKTTLINRILDNAMETGRVAVIENEFGKIGVDGERFAESGVVIKEISNGCICCSLFGDFVFAACKLISQVRPDRIIVEPTGVSKLTDVLKALEEVGKAAPIRINMVITVVDPFRHALYEKMFGEFYTDQIRTADTIFVSRTQDAPKDLIRGVTTHLSHLNRIAAVVVRPWDAIGSTEIVSIGEKNSQSGRDTLFKPYSQMVRNPQTNEDFEVWSTFTSARYTKAQFTAILHGIVNPAGRGEIFRSKGHFQTPDGCWLEYDYVPGESCFRESGNMETGKIVCIGRNLNPSCLAERFCSPAVHGAGGGLSEVDD